MHGLYKVFIKIIRKLLISIIILYIYYVLYILLFIVHGSHGHVKTSCKIDLKQLREESRMHFGLLDKLGIGPGYNIYREFKLNSPWFLTPIPFDRSSIWTDPLHNTKKKKKEFYTDYREIFSNRQLFCAIYSSSHLKA